MGIRGMDEEEEEEEEGEKGEEEKGDALYLKYLWSRPIKSGGDRSGPGIQSRQ